MLFFWPALFMKGGEAEVPSGTSFLIQTTQDVSFNTSKLEQNYDNSKNSAYEKLNEIDPCGEKPQAPPTYNDPQFRKTPKYKVYYKKLDIWEDCKGI